METVDPQALQDEIERLNLELSESHAARERLVLATDAELRAIERVLHEGVQQQLVALAVNLQLAAASVESEPAAARTLLEQMGREVQRALDESARLAERIYAPLLDVGGLAVALRSAAVSAGLAASVEVKAGSGYPPELARTVYLCWLEALEHGGEMGVAITVREEPGGVAFEIALNAADSDAGFEWLRERVEALAGRLTIRSQPGGGTLVSGSLPLSR